LIGPSSLTHAVCVSCHRVSSPCFVCFVQQRRSWFGLAFVQESGQGSGHQHHATAARRTHKRSAVLRQKKKDDNECMRTMRGADVRQSRLRPIECISTFALSVSLSLFFFSLSFFLCPCSFRCTPASCGARQTTPRRRLRTSSTTFTRLARFASSRRRKIGPSSLRHSTARPTASWEDR